MKHLEFSALQNNVTDEKSLYLILPKPSLMATSKKSPISTIKDPFEGLAAPAKRALASKGITNIKKLAGFTEKEIAQLHGMGPSSIPKLKKALKEEGLKFKEAKQNEKETVSTKTTEVDGYMKKLKHPLLPVVVELRKIILSADKNIGEEIKWNAPCFFFTGPMKPFNPKEYKRFIVGFNFFQKDCIRMIFLTGAKINDKSGLLSGDYEDGRRLAHFKSLKEVKEKEKHLRAALKKWLRLLDKG
jgi:hypothetical protein